MTRQDSLCDRQTQARTLIYIRVVEMLEGSEEQRCVFHIEPDAVIGKIEHMASLVLCRSKLNFRYFFAFGKFDRIDGEIGALDREKRRRLLGTS
jgi:hypothetical protein